MGGFVLMVNLKEEIEKIITDIINNTHSSSSSLDIKCGPTISEMKSTLSGLSHEEQYKQLTEQGLLNPLEEKDFQEIPNTIQRNNEWIEIVQDNLNKGKYDFDEDYKQELIDEIKKKQEENNALNDELFQYGRRLIEGYETELPLDLNEYQGRGSQRDEQIGLWERDDYGDLDYSYEITHDMGYAEEKTIDNQQSSIQLDDSAWEYRDDETILLNDPRVESMNNYFAGDLSHINYEISHKGYLDKINETARKDVKNIDSLMEESDGLAYDTLLFRGGHFDIHTRVGETISFKGYTSTTFQSDVAKYYGGDSVEDRKYSGDMLYLIHAHEGTKGIAGNDERFENGFLEHEYVLPRNIPMKVLRIDYENMVCELFIED